jgi:hypothetical protein
MSVRIEAQGLYSPGRRLRQLASSPDSRGAGGFDQKDVPGIGLLTKLRPSLDRASPESRRTARSCVRSVHRGRGKRTPASRHGLAHARSQVQLRAIDDEMHEPPVAITPCESKCLLAHPSASEEPAAQTQSSASLSRCSLPGAELFSELCRQLLRTARTFRTTGGTLLHGALR